MGKSWVDCVAQRGIGNPCKGCIQEGGWGGGGGLKGIEPTVELLVGFIILLSCHFAL